MAKRENDNQGDLPLGTPANLVLPKCLGGFKLENFEGAMKNASVLLSCDVKKATFDQIVAKRGDFALVFGVKGFDVEIDDKSSTITITEEEDDPEPPLTKYHDQPKDLDEEEGEGGEDEAGEQSDASQAEPKSEPQPVLDDEKDEDPQAQRGREWREACGGQSPKKRKSGSRKRKPRSPKR